MLSDTNFFLGGGQNDPTWQTTWPPPFDRLVTESRKKSLGPIIYSNLKEKKIHKLFFFMLSNTNFFLGGGQNGRTSLTTWPSPFDRLVTESKRKRFSPIIDANLKEKQNNNFFHQLFLLMLSDTNFLGWWTKWSNFANHVTLAIWPCGHRIKKKKFWSHYWCQSEGKTKQ